MRGSDSSGSGFARRPAQASSTTLERLRTGGDLIADIHRQHRRRRLTWGARIAVVTVVAALVAIAVWAWSAHKSRAGAVQVAQSHLLLGTAAEVGTAAQMIATALEDSPHDAALLRLYALVRGHAWLEFGDDEALARAALSGVPAQDPASPVAEAMLAFADGAIDDAATALARLPEDAEVGPIVRREALWLGAMIAVATAGPHLAEGARDEDGPIAAARDRVASWVLEHGNDVALRRQLAALQLHAGFTQDALATLAELRDDSVGHMGLAADDALYHAVLRTKLAGVASVADQLLESNPPGLSSTDRAHAVLARAVVHAHSGERDQALLRLDEAWDGLAPWNTLVRRLAIETALEAGDATRVEAWVEQTLLPGDEAAIFRAWGVLLGGDAMEALRLLALLPQAHPRVGYLQALALVEQGRWAEAQPWLTRTETLLPGRVEIEVARARIELRTGNAETALNKLSALAQFEPYAPRAWTGLGEAYLMQRQPDLGEAKRALQRAVDREPVPADATLLLAEVALRGKGSEVDRKLEALRLFEQAAAINPRLPKYGEALALHLASLGLLSRAQVALQQELDRPGAGFAVPLALAEVLRRGVDPDRDAVAALLDKAEARGAPAGALAVERAQVALLRGGEEELAAALLGIRAQLQQTPTDVAAQAMAVRILLAQHDTSGADAALRRALQAVAEGNKGRLYFEWARLESRTGKRRSAAPRSRRAWVEMLAEERTAWELLDAAELSLRLWLSSKMERVALTIATQLTERVGYHSEAWALRARAELAAGETRDARSSADKATALDEANPRAHEIRGDVLLRLGDRQGAKKAYERAVALTAGTSLQKSFAAHLKRL